MRRARRPRPPGILILGFMWFLLLAGVLFLAATPIAMPVQGLYALTGISVIILLKHFVATNTRVRFLVLTVAGVYVLRYWFWRLTETLPSPDDPVSFAVALVLFGAETFTAVLFFLTALITSDPTDNPPPKPMRPSQVPSVDILVPSYNEPEDLLAVTLAAAMQINYPEGKKTVVLCDDGGTDQRCNHPDPKLSQAAQARRATLQAMCREMGVVYATRARNEHAKAGNLNSALKKLNGDLVLILDADHVPTRDFLARTAGYFVENPRLFLVQTPHFFTNRDPIERNIGLPETCPTENEMFYSTIHRGLDRLGGAFFCGSAALLRRKALDEVGGISGRTITEDAETALDIHARGWESMYVNRAMIAGLQPETFASFIQQRGRWATGMMQILILKNPLFRTGLTMAQRLCYINSMSFWLFPLVRMTFLLSPLFYLFFGLQVFVVQPDGVLAYILPYLLIAFLIQNALFARVRWPLISEVYEIAQTPYLLKAVFATMLRPNAAKFNVTAKDETLDNDFISPVMKPLLLLALLLLGGLVAAVVRWYMFPGDRIVVEIVGGWALFNFILGALALRSVFERQRRLRKPRTEIMIPAELWAGGNVAGTGVPVIMRVITAKTLQFTIVEDEDSISRIGEFRPGAMLALRPIIPAAPSLQHRLDLKITNVSHQDAGTRGTTVTCTIDDAQMIKASEVAAFLVYGNSEKWVAAREAVPQPRGLLAGIGFVFRLSILSIVPSFIGLIAHRGAPQQNNPRDESRNANEKSAIETYLADHAAGPKRDEFILAEEPEREVTA